MISDNLPFARISHPDNHPIMIGVQENREMGAWDAMLIVGNFKSKRAADEAMKTLQRVVQERFGAGPNQIV